MRDTKEDQMSPDDSPGAVSKKTGVRRVNNLPVYIVGGLMGVFLLIMILVAAGRAAQQNKPPGAKDEKTGNTSMFANEIAGNQKDGIIQAEKAGPLTVPDLSKPDEGALAIARPDNLDAPPTPPSSAGNLQGDARSNDELQRIRMVKMQQLEEAIKAKTRVQVTTARSSGSPPGGIINSGVPATREEAIARLAAVRQQIDAQTRDDPTAAYKARLQQLQASGLVGRGRGRRFVGSTALADGRNQLGRWQGLQPIRQFRARGSLEARFSARSAAFAV